MVDAKEGWEVWSMWNHSHNIFFRPWINIDISCCIKTVTMQWGTIHTTSDRLPWNFSAILGFPTTFLASTTTMMNRPFQNAWMGWQVVLVWCGIKITIATLSTIHCRCGVQITPSGSQLHSWYSSSWLKACWCFDSFVLRTGSRCVWMSV